MTSSIAWVLLVVSGGQQSIDSILSAAWQRAAVQPVERCSDDIFLRRVSLDLAGRIPTLAEIRRFRKTPNRGAKIDELLASEGFPRFWSEVWTASLNGYSDAFDSDREVLRAWLQESWQEKVPYDRMASDLIVARGTSALDGPVNFLVRHPDDPTVQVVRQFLGVRLDCARCHDHPYDRWTQTDFRRMNRFFEATRRQEVSEGNIRLVNVIPERPRFLTGSTPRTSQWRDELALFVTRSRPFARTFANRVWYQLMGRGIVHPPDDFNRQNAPTVPRLVEFLAEQTRDEGFSLRELVRRICNSRAYQLSTQGGQPGPDRAAVFASRTLRPLTPEQTFDSATTALGIDATLRERSRFIRRTVGESLDEDFSLTWDYRETVQTLMWRLDTTLPVPSTSLDELFLRILSREPTVEEQQLCHGRPLEDVVFALVNSNEFYFNH